MMQPKEGQVFSHTEDYIFIERALKNRWEPCEMLAKEFENFTPRAIEDYADERASEFDRLLALNPTSGEADLLEFVDRQIAGRSDPELQIYMKFANAVMSEYVTVAFLSHALCEAFINKTLALGLTTIGAPDLFEMIEKADIKEKWVVGPKTFHADYSFPKGGALYETLKHLTRQRNELVHYKIELEVAGEPVLPGSRLLRPSLKEHISWMRRYFSLPYDLSDFLLKAIPSSIVCSFHNRSPIQMASAHAEA